MTALRLKPGITAAIAALAAAGIAAVYVLALLAMSKTIVAMLLGMALFVVGLWLSGNPRLLCLYGLIFTVPLTIGKDFMPIPHMGGAGAYSIEASDVFLFILAGFLIRDAIAWRRPIRLPAQVYWWLIPIVIGLSHVALGSMRHLAAQEVLQMSKGLLLFIVLVNEIVRLKIFEHVFWALAGSVFLQSLIAIGQYIKKGDLGLQVLGEAESKYLELTNLATYGAGAEPFRIGGLLGHPNLLAGFIVIILPILFAMLSVRMGQLRKGALIVVMGTAGLALLLTLSRSGWMSGAFGVVIVLGLGIFVGPQVRRFAPLSVMSIVGGTVVGTAAAPLILQRLFNSDRGALDFRWEWMEVAWGMVQKHPFTGVGLNSFVFRLPGNNPYGGPEGLTERFGENWPVVHNIYLIFWSELGTFGFIGLVGLLLSLLWVGLAAARNATEPMIYAILVGGMGGIGAIILDGMGSFFIRNAACGRIFWVVAALIVAAAIWQRTNGNAPLVRGR